MLHYALPHQLVAIRHHLDRLPLFCPLPLPPLTLASDFAYSQVIFTGPISWPGQTHEGFSKLAAYVWATGVQSALDDLVLAPGSNIQHVVVAGHSMGGGVGTLLAYTTQVGREGWRFCIMHQ